MIDSKKRILLTLAVSSIYLVLNIMAVTSGSAELIYPQIENIINH